MNSEFLQIFTVENLPSFVDPLYWRYIHYLPVALLGFIIVLLLTPAVGFLAKKQGVLNETVENRRSFWNKHENIKRRINPNRVPLLGGLAVLIPFILFLLIVFGLTPITIPIIIATSILVTAGVIDDMFNLPATIQFIVQLTAASLVAFSVIDLEFVKIPFDGILYLNNWTYANPDLFIPVSIMLPGDLIMIFWIMVLINSIKWVGGIDALMESNVAIAFMLLYVIGLREQNDIVVLSSIFLFGAIIAFIFYNFPPAKIFSGSVGKSTYGFILAVLALLNDAKFALTIMILMLPLMDFLFVLIKRVISNKPENLKDLLIQPLKVMRMADTNHLHHQFLKLGFTPKQVLLLEVSISLFIGIIAVTIAEAYRLLFLFGIGIVVLLGILMIHKFVGSRESKKDPPPEENDKKRESPESRYSY